MRTRKYCAAARHDFGEWVGGETKMFFAVVLSLSFVLFNLVNSCCCACLSLDVSEFDVAQWPQEPNVADF